MASEVASSAATSAANAMFEIPTDVLKHDGKPVRKCIQIHEPDRNIVFLGEGKFEKGLQVTARNIVLLCQYEGGPFRFKAEESVVVDPSWERDDLQVTVICGEGGRGILEEWNEDALDVVVKLGATVIPSTDPEADEDPAISWHGADPMPLIAYKEATPARPEAVRLSWTPEGVAGREEDRYVMITPKKLF